jgi:hypothetical protein
MIGVRVRKIQLTDHSPATSWYLSGMNPIGWYVL